ncbi:hypothetical protein J2S13_002431 [Oikeobacillus pervagus]|uniref:BioX protein n=1 Tax=Oikeobacillus pervagus TaxID=1325931 RepID=A0AAJ1T529_9BACI|nr:hypothetical protein [Oikeobacillus pervagus]MDQ0216009.1 hypothetical protein [Oikeobacillus pervagus]
MKKGRVYSLVELSLLAALISVTGFIKIPTGFPGSEFQLSAPVAVAITAVFGFKRYIIAGVISSLLMFSMGIHNILNIEVAFVFRLVAGGLVALLGTATLVLLFAGPLGTMAARYILSLTLGVPFLSLVIPAIPGMIYTAVAVIPLVKMFQYVRRTGGISVGKSI